MANRAILSKYSKMSMSFAMSKSESVADLNWCCAAKADLS